MFVRLLIVFALLVAVSPVVAQQRVALLIGNQDYKRGVGRLVNPFNDIRIVGDALRKVGFAVMKPVRNATRADILDALDRYAARLKQAGPGAIGFVYYSGHGIASKGTNYLIPVDVDRPSTRLLRANGVKQSEILSLVRSEAPQAAHYLVIDACRNELQGARGGKGFVAVNQQAGTLIAFATSPGKTASDLGSGSGPYAKALAAELIKPGVTDLQMFSNVRFAVSTATGGDQVPWTLDGIVRRDRVMFGGRQKTTPVVSPAARDWHHVRDSRSPAALRAFAQRYKDTVFADMALAMADRLDEAQKSSPSRPSSLQARPSPKDANDVASLLAADGYSKVKLALEAPTLYMFFACKGGQWMVIKTRRNGQHAEPPARTPKRPNWDECPRG